MDVLRALATTHEFIRDMLKSAPEDAALLEITMEMRITLRALEQLIENLQAVLEEKE